MGKHGQNSPQYPQEHSPYPVAPNNLQNRIAAYQQQTANEQIRRSKLNNPNGIEPINYNLQQRINKFKHNQSLPSDRFQKPNDTSATGGNLQQRIHQFQQRNTTPQPLRRSKLNNPDGIGQFGNLQQRINTFRKNTAAPQPYHRTRLNNTAGLEDVNLRQRMKQYQNQAVVQPTFRNFRITPDLGNLVDLQQRVTAYENQSGRPKRTITLRNANLPIGLEALRVASPERAKELMNYQARKAANTMSPPLSGRYVSTRTNQPSIYYGPHSRFTLPEEFAENQRQYEESQRIDDGYVPMALKQRVEKFTAKTPSRTVGLKNKESNYAPLSVASPERAKQLFESQMRQQQQNNSSSPQGVSSNRLVHASPERNYGN